MSTYYCEEEQDDLKNSKPKARLEQVAKASELIDIISTLQVYRALQVWVTAAQSGNWCKYDNTANQCSKEQKVHKSNKVSVMSCDAVEEQTQEGPDAGDDNDDEEDEDERWCKLIVTDVVVDD